jgi:hypothetical protein
MYIVNISRVKIKSRESARLGEERDNGSVGAGSAIAQKSAVERNARIAAMFNFGKPKTAGQWMAHVVLGIVALFLVWWMLRLYVL